jgi:hypothetical protein
MESTRRLAIEALRALIVFSEMEQERLHAILDDDSEDVETREDALEELARVLQNHRRYLIQMDAFE